jgi:large subunit ribosomal protein L24
MKIRKNDNVAVITGKDKGKTGKVLRVYPSLGKLVVEGVNVVVKHVRPKRTGEKGQKVYFPAKIAVSNVMMLCPKCGKKTRIGSRPIKQKSELGRKEKKDRICKKCHDPLTV